MNAKTPTSTDTEENSDPNTGNGNGNGASIGGLLRASRNRRNEALSDVSSDLRIRQVYLEAIENNEFEVLPGAIYAIGFIRSYAEYLGLDGEEIVRRYKSEASTTESKPDLTFPTLVPEHGIPGGAIVMLGLVLAAIGYGSWYFVSSRNVFVTEQVPAVPEKLATLVGEKPVATEPLKSEEKVAETPDETKVEATTETEADKAVKEVVATAEEAKEKIEEVTPAVAEKIEEKIEAVSAVQPATDTPTPSVPEIVKIEEAKPEIKPTEPAVEPQPEPEPKVEAAAEPATPEKVEAKPEPIAEPEPEPKAEAKVEPKPEPKPEPEVEPKPEVAALPEKAPASKPAAKPAPAATGSSRITLRAITDSYIQVRDNDADQLLITRLLKQGQSYQVPDRTGLSLITGNAGALEILVDGTAVPSIGPIGAVRRNVVLKAEKLKDGSAVIE